MEKSEHEVWSREHLEFLPNEHYLVWKLPLENHVEKVSRKIEECHQHIAVPLKVYYSYWWLAITGFKSKTIMRTVEEVCSVTALGVLYSSPDCLDTHWQLLPDPKTTIFGKTWCLVMNTGSCFGQMIIAYGWGGTLLNGTSLTMASRQTLLEQQA